MLVMEYAKGGSLYDYLQEYFVNITWTEKIKILMDISSGYLYFQCINLVFKFINY
jgi:hypothetical protein